MKEDIQRRADVKMIKSKDAEGRVVMKKSPRKEIKLESSDAYGKALEKKREAAKHAAMTSSDKDKLGKVADMMRKEREKRMSEGSDQHKSMTKKVYGNMMGGLKDDKPKKPASSSDMHKRMMKKVYGNMMGGLKEMEEVELDELNFRIAKSQAGQEYQARKAKMRQDQHKQQDPKHAKTHARNMVDMDKAASKAAKKGVAMRDYGKDNWKVRNSVKRGKLPEEMQIDEIKVGDYVKPNVVGGAVHRVFAKNGNSLEVGKYHGPNKFGGSQRIHVSKVVKVNKPSVKEETSQVDEYITSKQIRMARGIANDPRHKGGDYTGAARKMEKIKKGLSNHPAAQKALRQANEDVNEAKDHPAAAELKDYAKKHGGIDKGYFQSAAGHINHHKETGRMSELVRHIKSGDTDPRDKVLDVIHKHDKALSKSVHHKAGFTRLRESTMLSFAEVAGQRGRPKKGEDAESDKHIIMQLRSAQDLDGNKHIEFRGGKKAKVPLHHINSILKLHDHPQATPRHKRVIRAVISKGPDHLAKLAGSVSKNVK